MKHLKILLVDDEKEFVKTLAKRLQMRGVQVQTAGDGENALRLLDKADFAPDVVIMDVMMPGISGLETLKRIRKKFPALPVILLTGLGMTKEGMEGMRLGAFDYMLKPVDMNELSRKLEEATESGT